MNLLVGVATGSLEILKETIKAIAKEGGKEALKVIGEEAIEYLTKKALEKIAEKLALPVLEEMNLYVEKERVLLEACIVTQSYVVRAMTNKRIFDELVSSAEAGTEVSIAEIKAV